MRYRYLYVALIVVAVGGALLFSNSVWFSPIETRDFVDDLLGNAEVTVKNADELEIVLVGDIMLSRYVGTQMRNTDNWTLPFDDLAYELARADITFGNLESPFLETGPRVTDGLVFKAEPRSVEGLVKAGFDVVSTANNHAFDQGFAGLAYTNDLLRQNGIIGVGTGTTTAAAWQPAVFEVANTRVAFIAASYASQNDGGRSRNNYVARTDDEEFLRQAIEQLRADVDVIIVSLHAGEEYTSVPNQQQQDFARSAIEIGADIVVGHHPHWVQEAELYSATPTSTPGLIFYSLGNFVFDQGWSQKTKEGLMVRIKIKDKQIDSATLVPIIIENYCCARLANDQEAAKILRDINATATIDLSPEMSPLEP
jgi:poly-gamma-glutamate synthesis protein (capsule biosynthesis protein)